MSILSMSTTLHLLQLYKTVTALDFCTLSTWSQTSKNNHKSVRLLGMSKNVLGLKICTIKYFVISQIWVSWGAVGSDPTAANRIFFLILFISFHFYCITGNNTWIWLHFRTYLFMFLLQKWLKMLRKCKQIGIFK